MYNDEFTEPGSELILFIGNIKKKMKKKGRSGVPSCLVTYTTCLPICLCGHVTCSKLVTIFRHRTTLEKATPKDVNAKKEQWAKEKSGGITSHAPYNSPVQPSFQRAATSRRDTSFRCIDCETRKQSLLSRCAMGRPETFKIHMDVDYEAPYLCYAFFFLPFFL